MSATTSKDESESIAPAPKSTDVLPRIRESHAKEIDTRGVYVYGPGLRAWHWITVLAICILVVTGYLVGSPLPSIGGEASSHFLFGKIRFLHFAAGLVLAVAFAARVGLAAFGTPLHREIFLPRVDKRGFRHDFVAEAKWYAFLRSEPNPTVGHNPIAQVVMLCLFTLPSIFMILTGLSLYAEGLGGDSALDRAFGWVRVALGGSQTTHTLHHLGMWAIVVFVVLHVYAVIREDVLGGSSTLSVIVSGYRYFRGKGHFHDETEED